MDEYTRGRLAGQVRQVRRHRERLLDDHDLCLTRLLPQEDVQAALERHQVRYRERLYTPLLTIWMFLYQVLASDQSCRAAVARLLAFLCVNGQGSASAKTDPYCKARQRLPEPLVADLARHTAGSCIARLRPTGLLGGRPIKIADGTTVSMPDTPANQKAYPQQPGQKTRPGVSHPAPGGPDQPVLRGGARRGHGALSRQADRRDGSVAAIAGPLQSGEVLLADASYYQLLDDRPVARTGRGPAEPSRWQAADGFRRGQQLGRHDHIVSWHKPIRPAWLSKSSTAACPRR